MNPLAYLTIALGLALPVGYAVMKFNELRVVQEALLQGERNGAASVAAATTKRADEVVAAVNEGEAAAEPAPADKSKLIALCNRSASCRDRKR